MYIFFYYGAIILSLICGNLVFNRYRNISGFFFLLFTVFASLWFTFYFFFFSGFSDKDILLFFSRSAYAVSILGIYSFLLFIGHFQSKKEKFFTKKVNLIFVVYGILFGIYVFTPFIIRGLDYEVQSGVYREINGEMYNIHIFLSLIFVPLFLYIGLRQLSHQSYLNKIRLKNIMFSAFFFILFLIFFQLILPLFHIWLLEKEIIIFFLLFLGYVYFTLKRYYFSSVGYGLGKVLLGIISFIVSISILGGIRLLYGGASTTIANYWGFQDQYFIIDIGLGIILYQIFYRLFYRYIIGNTEKAGLNDSISQLEKNLSTITRFEELDNSLGRQIKKIFKTHFYELRIFSRNGRCELQKYFESEIIDKIFINDLVFIEENKNKFQRDLILSEIPKEAFLILPLYDKNEKNIGVLLLGSKSFGDFYTILEIDALRQFVFFLELHLKYIQTYEKIQEYSMNLDKKVDEKTIEYNDLINKQKEFISVISHEIKSPIASAIFQADSILDDIDSGKNSVEYLRSEVSLLNTQLIKTGELLSKLFSVQYYDTHSVTLFREKVQIARLLETECEICAKMNEQIQFITRIDRSMGFIELDRIQFQQVIGNILQNAVKFSCPKNPIITVEASIQECKLTIIIEDNGRGFEGIDVQKLFDKYATGGGVSAGLGMGLYLCKRIVEMHGGVIEATSGANGIGARFTIYIPVYS